MATFRTPRSHFGYRRYLKHFQRTTPLHAVAAYHTTMQSVALFATFELFQYPRCNIQNCSYFAADMPLTSVSLCLKFLAQ